MGLRPGLKMHALFIFFISFIYFQRWEGREKEKERNINVWLPPHPPHWGPGPHPRHVPLTGN